MFAGRIIELWSVAFLCWTAHDVPVNRAFDDMFTLHGNHCPVKFCRCDLINLLSWCVSHHRFLMTEPGPIAKSNIILDVKPWDDETDLVEMERLVRTIQMEGLLWGACKLNYVEMSLNASCGVNGKRRQSLCCGTFQCCFASVSSVFSMSNKYIQNFIKRSVE